MGFPSEGFVTGDNLVIWLSKNDEEIKPNLIGCIIGTFEAKFAKLSRFQSDKKGQQTL